MELSESIYLCSILISWPLHVVVCCHHTLRLLACLASVTGSTRTNQLRWAFVLPTVKETNNCVFTILSTAKRAQNTPLAPFLSYLIWLCFSSSGLQCCQLALQVRWRRLVNNINKTANSTSNGAR